MIARVFGVLALLAIAIPARGQSPDPFLSVPSRPAPAAPRPAPAPRPAAPMPAPAPAPAPPPLPTSFGAKGFHCPPAGTVVVREAAGKSYQWSYGGADPADAEICVMTGNGKVGNYIFGIVGKDNPSVRDFAAGYRKILSGPPGTATDFLSRATPFANGSTWHEHFENEALETLQIGGEARPTIRVAITERGVFGNSFAATWHRWFDVQTGAIIRQSFQQISGQPALNQDWTAASIVVPKP